MSVIWLVSLLALLISPLQAQERSDLAVTQLLSTTRTSSGQLVVLPQKDAQVVASVYDIAPRTRLPVHNNPYPRYLYVLSGNLRIDNIDTGQIDTYKRGDFILESVGQWHTSTSVGHELLKLLVIDVVEKGQSNIVPLK